MCTDVILTCQTLSTHTSCIKSSHVQSSLRAVSASFLTARADDPLLVLSFPSTQSSGGCTGPTRWGNPGTGWFLSPTSCGILATSIKPASAARRSQMSALETPARADNVVRLLCNLCQRFTLWISRERGTVMVLFLAYIILLQTKMTEVWFMDTDQLLVRKQIHPVWYHLGHTLYC